MHACHSPAACMHATHQHSPSHPSPVPDRHPRVPDRHALCTKTRAGRASITLAERRPCSGHLHLHAHLMLLLQLVTPPLTPRGPLSRQDTHARCDGGRASHPWISRHGTHAHAVCPHPYSVPSPSFRASNCHCSCYLVGCQNTLEVILLICSTL